MCAHVPKLPYKKEIWLESRGNASGIQQVTAATVMRTATTTARVHAIPADAHPHPHPHTRAYPHACARAHPHPHARAAWVGQ